LNQCYRNKSLGIKTACLNRKGITETAVNRPAQIVALTETLGYVGETWKRRAQQEQETSAISIHTAHWHTADNILFWKLRMTLYLSS